VLHKTYWHAVKLFPCHLLKNIDFIASVLIWIQSRPYSYHTCDYEDTNFSQRNPVLPNIEKFQKTWKICPTQDFYARTNDLSQKFQSFYSQTVVALRTEIRITKKGYPHTLPVWETVVKNEIYTFAVRCPGFTLPCKRFLHKPWFPSVFLFGRKQTSTSNLLRLYLHPQKC